MKTRNSDPMKFIPVQTSCDEKNIGFGLEQLMTGTVYHQIS